MRSDGWSVAIWLIAAVIALAFSHQARAADPLPFKLETYRGHVVFLNDALAKRYGITTVPEAADRSLALQTADGALVPIVEDVRGRAFRVDERLRKPEVEILARKFQGVPAVQVIRLFEVTKDGKLELDYWCDICAISMVELKPCECCQGETVLRRRKVEE
ncbi:MAG: hypothetical protein L0211_23415 [Planctomycetaceae bacterium]|nr:hypothetical protein [Planctomycetaceae bacterium]